MNRKGFFISKPVFFSALGAAIVLLSAAGFLFEERNSMQEQTRKLIIQNDSIMSVNIVLSDSLSGKSSNADAKKTVLSKPNLEK